MFDHSVLQPEQEELFLRFVELARAVPRECRGWFVLAQSFGGDHLVPPDSALPQIEAPEMDLGVLADHVLLLRSAGSRGSPLFNVSPQGFRYYEDLKRRRHEPVERLEQELRSFLDTDAFRRRHTGSFAKWLEAETLLWDADAPRSLTLIGHLCRESMQLFATELVAATNPAEVDPDEKHTKRRIWAVLDHRKDRLGSTELPFLKALIAYQDAVDDLIQRQEHGAQREGKTLVWEDARRVAFQTLVAMYEIDRAVAD